MSSYKHILVGLDLSPESQQVIDRVKFLLSNTETKISICHILEPLAFTYGGDIPADQHVILGHPAQEMHSMANAEDIELIVVGSHGRHGLSLIFGSTSNSVLHGAQCDVLAVRIKN